MAARHERKASAKSARKKVAEPRATYPAAKPTRNSTIVAASRRDLVAAFVIRSLGEAARGLGLAESEIALILDVDRKTLARWKAGAMLSVTSRGRLEALNQLHHLLTHAFATPEIGISWFHTAPVPQFGGHTPLWHATHGGFESVVGALAGLEAGQHT